MQNTDNLTEKLKRLPDEHQHEIADFVDFLLSRIPETPDAARVLRDLVYGKARLMASSMRMP
jgi:hypothetical protein